MKNNILFLLALVSVLSFSSCKKKIETCKLGKSYISNGNTTPNPNTYSYYSDGRLQKVVYAGGSKDSLTYFADTLNIYSLDATGSVLSVFAGIVNGSGSVTSATKNFLDLSGNVTASETYTFEYNSAGNLTKKTTTNLQGTTVLNLNYSGSNTATGTVYKGVDLESQFTFYHGTVENKTRIDDLDGAFTPYFGSPSQNLLDSMHIITSTDDTVRIQYAHTLDENEYIDRTIKTYLTPGVETKYFSYQYFDCAK